MAITPHIDPQTGLVTVTVRGEVDGAMIKEALQGVVDHPRFKTGADMLWDFTRAQGKEATGEGLQDLVSFVASLREKRGSGYRVALVASGDLEYGFARMYEAYAEHLPLVVRVFRNLEEANQWLATAPPEQNAQT